MNKIDWQIHHGFSDEDMALIDLCLSAGGKITAIFDMVLDYEIIKLSGQVL